MHMLQGNILEKPQDEKDAFNMLSSLSGCQHKVYTGVSLVLPPLIPDPKVRDPPVVRTFWEETKVEFANIEDVAIEAYINSGEPMDKAGAYGIQGIGGTFVKAIVGCFFNVMGFPVHRFAVEIDQLIKAGAFAE
uniref:Maf-like protein n=1 Tax=Araucaria cunninghamii TaxID=56994 RepID=A0A0D6R862_ARACU